MSSSVVVVHSNAPRRDYEVLTTTLPRRFRSAAVGSSLSFSLTDESSSERILVLPTPYSTNGGRTVVVDDQEFETVSLCNNPAVATSYACLVLSNRDELVLMAELVSEQEGLVVEMDGSVGLAKFLLPGGCMVTLSTTATWTSNSTRSKIVEFMVSPVATTTSTTSLSGSTATRSSRKKSRMRRSTSMPDMIPPMVTTNNNNPLGQTKIPTLETKVLSLDGRYESFPLNSQEPIPIETELFVGKILLICRPSTGADDPYWNEIIFSKKKRRVVLQLQGKLKYQPTGTVFAGMEVSDPMKLGLIANGLCSLILKMITKTFNPALHYSFGTKDERAHICFPASTFFETVVVTPPDKTPPAMGNLDFEGESPEAGAARRAYKTKIDWNTEDTYSMSFHSMYVDFPTWSVVSLPVGKDVPLQTFWGNSLASVVLYERDKDTADDKPHLVANSKYILNVQLQNLGTEGRPNATALQRQQSTSLMEDDENTEGAEDMSEWGSEVGGGEESTSTMGDIANLPAFDEDDDENDDEEDTMEFFDTVESLPNSEGFTTLDLSSNTSHHALLGVIDAFCPCWIDMFSKRGKYSTVYAFCGKGSTNSLPLFRTAEMVEKLFGSKSADHAAEVDDRFSHRISSLEKIRRVMGLKYAQAHTPNGRKDYRKLQHFHKHPCRFDARFLRRKERPTTKVIGLRSGFVARALSDRHWKEERMVLADNTGELLFHHVDGSRIHFKIPLSDVTDASIPEIDDRLPLPGYHYLQIETYVHVTYLMFRSKEERDSWMDTLDKMLKDRRSVRSFTKELSHYEDPFHEFLSKSSMWNCQKRKVLNCRRCSFRTPSARTPEETLQLAESALAKVLSLKPKTGSNDSELKEFLDCAAALKEADAHSLNEEEKCAFFVNVYHVMIMHSYIILGPPVSGTEWVSYFNNIAYQCSDDIFSLAELEHNIIRAKMAYPSSFLSRFVLPKSQYHFALTRPDFRLNFALNAGSLSMPTSGVPIYKPEALNEQMNKTTQEFVGYTVHIRDKGNDVQVTLPRICQWFAEDFGPNASASDVLFAIEPYLSDEKRETLKTIWNAKKKTYEIGIFSLKYPSFNYECRFLTALSE